jgi:CRISPR-associated protein Csm5
LRTGMVFAGLKDNSIEKVAAQLEGDRPPRHPADLLEERSVGVGGGSRSRAFQASDSAPVSTSSFKVYLLRVSTLATRGRGEGFELGWKQSPKGAVNGARPQESTPSFAEMASPGTVFEGAWSENQFLRQPEVLRALNWREAVSREAIFAAANQYASALLAAQKEYAEVAGLTLVKQDLERIECRLAEIQAGGSGCLLCAGWGIGLLAHVAWLKTDDAAYRRIIEQTRLFRSVYQGLPFPKTRRIVFLADRPAALPGWVELAVNG